MNSEYPRTIDNGHGETLTFVRRETILGEERVLLAGEVQAGKGPPMHTHLAQTESLTCEEGQLGYQIQGEEPKVIGPGETVTFPPGTPHKFWAAGGQPMRCTGYVSPPDNVEYFLSKIYESQKSNPAEPRPRDGDAAYLLGRYRREYDMVEIPSFVRKAIFPVLRGLTWLTGTPRHFADAPPPIAR
jgi:quercetin dioxygenase-like cupin family protein